MESQVSVSFLQHPAHRNLICTPSLLRIVPEFVVVVVCVGSPKHVNSSLQPTPLPLRSHYSTSFPLSSLHLPIHMHSIHKCITTSPVLIFLSSSFPIAPSCLHTMVTTTVAATKTMSVIQKKKSPPEKMSFCQNDQV